MFWQVSLYINHYDTDSMLLFEVTNVTELASIHIRTKMQRIPSDIYVNYIALENYMELALSLVSTFYMLYCTFPQCGNYFAPGLKPNKVKTKPNDLN